MTNKFILAAAGGDFGEIVAGAVLHWDFGDTNCWNRTNSTVTDLSGNGHNSTILSYNTGNESHSYNSNKGGYLEASNSGGAQLGMSGIGGNDGNIIFRNSWSSDTTFWGSTTYNQAYTLEFITNHTLPSGRLTSPSSSFGINTSTSTPSALYDYIGYDSSKTPAPVYSMSLIINGDGTGSACEISEIGFGSSERSTSTSTNTYTDINDYSPYANTTYPLNTAGDTTSWQQIIATYDGSNVNIYRNGSLIYGPRSQTANTKHAQMVLFSYPERFITAQGGWGIVRGYDKGLTAAEVLGQYNAQKSRFGI